MNKLSDFNLERGDWVKIGGRWHEYTWDEPARYPIVNDIFVPSQKVEAVLRPSFVVRDQLDTYLAKIQNYVYGAEAQPLATSNDGVCLFFKIIHPRKEEAKTPLETLSEIESGIIELKRKCDEMLKVLASDNKK